MNEIEELHSKAFQLENQAKSATNNGQHGKAKDLLIEALHLEIEAIDLCKLNYSNYLPTLYLTASHLSWKLRRFGQADNFIEQGLALDAPAHIKNRLLEQREQIDRQYRAENNYRF